MDRGSHRDLYFLAKTRVICPFQGQNYVMNNNANGHITPSPQATCDDHNSYIQGNPTRELAILNLSSQTRSQLDAHAIMSTVATDPHRIVTTP